MPMLGWLWGLSGVVGAARLRHNLDSFETLNAGLNNNLQRHSHKATKKHWTVVQTERSTPKPKYFIQLSKSSAVPHSSQAYQ